jgi:hypothetical protein
MVAVRIRAARKVIVFAFLVWGSLASATTYYVSSSTGNDGNLGTSSSTAWQTIAHVNGRTFQPGDSILFRRGDVWNESLAPASSGSSGNPITFDAYGSGAAPNLTGYYAVAATAWVLVTGNAWKAPLPATYSTVNFCLFGSVWGQKVGALSSNLTAQWDFYLANGYLYVFSIGNPGTYYNEPIVPMALSNVPVINVSGQSWLTFQHFLVNWFDQYGVYVQGASDHLVFANMEADSMIPQGTQPLGFYVDESAPGPGDVKIYNSEAHLNYDGFRFDGSAIAVTMVNDKGYANRDGALVDNTGAVTYSYCHFYASSLAVAGSTDVEWTSGSGPTAGAGNIAADTAPAVQVYQRYPAEITLTVDDAGMTAGADTYYAGTVLPVADAQGVPVGAAITVGYPLAQTLVAEFQGWVNAGRDVTSHSMSHTYYTNTDALEIQYTGSGTAAALSISNKTLTIAVTGASDSVTYNLAQGQTQGTIKGLRLALLATGKFTAAEIQTCQGPYGTGCSAYTEAGLLAQDLADVSGQDVRTAVYHMQLDVTRLTTDEITLSRQWMTTNLTGLPATRVYVYPGGYETTTMQGITAGVPYAGGRGALKEDLGVKDTYADGFNVQNITSFGVNPSWMGLTPAVLNQKIQALVWKESVWGVPWGIFWHLNELTNSDPVGGTEITNLIQDFKNSGATIRTNTGLVNWLLGGTQETGTDGNYYYKSAAASMALDLRPTKNSPVVDAGENLGTAYALDLNGENQNSYGSGWEIGAHVYQGYSVYGGGTGGGMFTIGPAANPLVAFATLPQVWVNNDEGDALFSYELALPNTWVTGPAPGCTFHTPYWSGTPTSTGLQSAINDMEACRTTSGVGIKLDIPPALYTSANGIVIPQTSNSVATNFLIIDSTQDSSLPNGQIVCAHGMQDNLASSSDIGLDNPDCAGDAMHYQLGATVTGIAAGAITLANGIATNTSNYNDAQHMWTAECSGGNCAAVSFCSPAGGGSVPTCGSSTLAPDHWLIEDMEARMNAGNAGNQNVINLPGSGGEGSLTEVAQHIHFRKVWQHGDWTSLTAGANSIAAGMAMNCRYCSLVDSQFSQNLRPGAEGYSLSAQGQGPYKLDHNWLEGQSIGIFSGGAESSSAYSIFGLVPFQDVEMRRNRLTFPYGWLGVISIPSGNAHWAGQNITRKSMEEIKTGERVLIAGNILENADNSGAQSGVEAEFNVQNYLLNYQLAVGDITFTNNIVRNSCAGFDVDGSNPNNSAGGGAAYPFRRGLWNNNLFYNVSASNPGCGGSSGNNMEFGVAQIQWQGTVTMNSNGTATFAGNCSVNGGATGTTGGTCKGQLSSITFSSSGSGQYYISPTGSDSNSGTSAASPWKTFAHAIPLLSPGNTLNLENGTYSSSNSGFIGANCSSGAQNGTSSAPITITAQNERQAHIQNDLTAVPVSISNCDYWNVYGLWVTGADQSALATNPPFYSNFNAQVQCNGCSHVSFYHNLVEHGDRCSNTHMIGFFYSTTSSSMIENEIYSWSRHGFIDYNDQGNTSATANEFARNYASKRNYTQITCANGYGSSELGNAFMDYGASSTIWENNISEGPMPSPSYGGSSLDTVSGTNLSNAKFFGNILLDGNFTQNPHTSTDIMSGVNYSNNVVITPGTYGFAIRGSTLNAVDHFSIFTPSATACGGACDGVVQDQNPPVDITPSSTMTSSVIFNNPGSVAGFEIVNGISTLSYLSAFGASGLSNVSVSNPFTAAPTNMGSCYLWIPASSNLHGAGSAGSDLGATVLYEYSGGSLTGEPLWSTASGAFRGGAIAAGVNNVAGSSLFDVQTRLNVNQNGCSYPSSYAGWVTNDGTYNLAIGAPAAGGIQATGTYAVFGGAVTSTVITNQGSLYLTPPSVTGLSGYIFTANLISTSTAPPAGEQVMDISAGDSVAITLCQTVPGLNVPTANYNGVIAPTGVGPVVTAGSAPWNGTYSAAGITVSYTWPGVAPGTSDASGYCTLSSLSGNPQGLTLTHNTFISDSQTALGAVTSNSQPNYGKNDIFQNNIVVLGTGSGTNGWWGSNRSEGAPTETYYFDTTSATFDHLVFPGRGASLYSAYCNNSHAPCGAPVMYFPATSYCTGATASSACVGFTGAMSATAMPLTLADYHNYGLRSDSSFYAGNAEQASDGANMGANIPGIDAAQTGNIYQCATACGSTGPYPDLLTPPAAASFFGFSENNTNSGGWPTVSYGMQRFWDSPSMQWPDINTASGVFTFASLDSDLALAYSNGTMEAMYTLARTPTWASSNPTDASCNYTTGLGGGDGECDAPSDLNSDGSGANAIWKAWITAIATHVNSPGYTATHAHIKYWEIWNEPDTQPFWAGSIAQLARLTEDANCIITGRGVIHQSGNGTATACTATAIDATAQIVMASAHAKSAALVYGQNELYCNNTSGIPAYELPCPNPPNAIAAAVDVINFHMKPGNETGNNCPAPTACTPESAMQWYLSNIQGILQPAELEKPLWDGEAQYSSTGFINAYADPDMAASFMPRFYLLNWSLGLDGLAWYYANSQAEPAQAETSYQQTYNWLVNASLVIPCAASGTVWSCTIQNGGTQYLILWDTSQSCASGSCTTGNQVVGSRWTQYQDMTSASSPIAISGHTVPVGIKAVVIH